MQFKASAPGSLMLLGEYAVLYGKQALTCAVDKRITVTLIPRSDMRIEIQSSTHGHYVTDLAGMQMVKPFQYVLGTLHQYQEKLKQGCHLDIVAEFSDQIGLGSSAAVTVATLACLDKWLDLGLSPHDMVQQGKNIVHLVQGLGSGADIAASVYGGMVVYQAQPFFVEKLAVVYPLTVLYAGFKTPTVQAIQHVQNYFSAYASLFAAMTNSIGQCAAEGIQMIRQNDWMKLGHIMNIQQGMMEALGVSTPLLHDMVEDLRQQPGILGAKISGSGLGDCIVGLGQLPENYVYTKQDGVQRIPLAVTLKGVCCEKIGCD